jgi:hypothetical protein
MRNRPLLFLLLAFTNFVCASAFSDESEVESRTRLIPLPIYATNPSEGSTWGLMPVVLYVDPKTERTEAILAPSVSWNDIIGTTGTFRLYSYPSDTRSWLITFSGSTHVNWGGHFEYANEPTSLYALTDNFFFRFQRSIFYRFFGIGPDTTEDDQTSHTRIVMDLSYRKGVNIVPNLNVGLRLRAAKNLVEAIGVPGYSISPYTFPTAPGMSQSAAISEEQFDLYYDTRKSKAYSTEGFYLGLTTGPAQGLSGGSPNFWDTSFEAKELFTETDRLQACARAYVHYVDSPNVPFYYQSSLGGSFLMRGFIEDRFIDQGGWTMEFEQRIQLLETHIYGVTADWRVDPFVAIGQVFGNDSGPFSNIKVAEGLGFRAWVKPNVLGRVDVAYAGEGVNTYVELGYPF